MGNQGNTNSINHAKTWQIAFFAFNNTATNVATTMMGYYAFFTQNVLMLSAVVVGLIATSMRIFDGITDPIIGYMIDKTDGKFGKFRPFMVMGNIVIVLSFIAIFWCPASLSETGRYIYTTIFYILYILGYTFQTAVTKAAQPILTNDPKQRPVFSMFDATYNAILMAVSPLIINTFMAPHYAESINDPMLWRHASLIFAAASLAFTTLAVIGIWEKDRTEFFGYGKNGERVRLSDCWKVLKDNQPLQMLIIGASTDKLAMMMRLGVTTYLFSNLFLNLSLQGIYSTATVIPTILVAMVGMAWSRKVGLKKATVLGAAGGCVLSLVMFIVGATPKNPIPFLVMLCVYSGCFQISGGLAIPMVADCADYELYRTGKFVPGIMGTLFSFVDKLISSLSTMLVGFAMAAVGMSNTQIIPNTFMGDSFNRMILVCFCLVPCLGHLATLIAMKFYPLTTERMAQIQEAIAEKKKNLA